MENFLWGIAYLMCFVMGAVCIIFGIKFLADCKKRETSGYMKEIIMLFGLVVLCGLTFIILPLLSMFGVLN